MSNGSIKPKNIVPIKSIKTKSFTSNLINEPCSLTPPLPPKPFALIQHSASVLSFIDVDEYWASAFIKLINKKYNSNPNLRDNFIRNDSWNNLAFSPEEAEALNEGTYLTNLIVPAIQASLKNLSHEKFTYIST
ncbi:572_t:CDS:2, partial [Funneliformis mosseae]